MEERIQQLEEEVATLKRQLTANQFGRDNFTSVDIVRKNWKHAGGKIAFFNGELVTQQSDIVALTDNTGSTPDSVIAQVSGSGADATINDNFSDIATKVNSVRTILRNLNLMG